jgi:tetratricopeptide (TPR) repeat protein
MTETFIGRQEECKGLLKAGEYGKAQVSCSSLVELAEKLPKERHLEKMSAFELAGHAMLYQKKFDAALSLFRNELAIGEASLRSTDAELGYAYHHVGLAYYSLGNFHEALYFYQKSEFTLRAAREHIDSEPLKNQYAKDIKGVLREYIVILRQAGQGDAASQAQGRADAIGRQIHP